MDNKTVSLPANSFMDFTKSGQITNGVIIGNNTEIKADRIVDNCHAFKNLMVLCNIVRGKELKESKFIKLSI